MLNSVITGPITLLAFLECIGAALVLGILTAVVFSARTKNTSSWKFSIALLPAVVTVVIMMVNGNIGAGLGVAGTFALVRFRSQPGSAKELTGLFFAVALGLICGMGYIGIAAIFFSFMALVVVALTKIRFGEADAAVRNLKITIPENLDYETIFDDLFSRYLKSCTLMTVKTTNMGTMYELHYEVVPKENASVREFIDEIRCRNGNLNIVFSRPAEDKLL